jgi:O-antigen/teichoic acid export membrane protein
MKKNMGGIDKAIRVLMAAVVFIVVFAKVITGTWAIILFILGVIFVLTSIVSFCPLYLPFGLSTMNKTK